MLFSNNKITKSEFDIDSDNYEIIKIIKTSKTCSVCEKFAVEKLDSKTPIAILSCEGACSRGEVSRQAANLICFSMLPETTSRICLGGAFTKNGGQRELVAKSERVIALEGCLIECASRMMKGVLQDIEPEIIHVDQLYSFDKNLFAINDVSEAEIKQYALTAANKIIEKIN